MTPPKRKTRAWPGKGRITQPRYSRRRQPKRQVLPRRAQNYQTVDVPEFVYRLLNANAHNQERGERSGRGRHQGKMRKYENLREPSYDTSSVRESSESVDESEYTKSGATSVENLSRVMDAANSSAATGSEDSSVSNVSVDEPITLANSIDNTRALLKKKSLVQIINNYIKAGIEEGKRQARKYIRKALSFGVRSGYLIPTDPQGQVIRVSPTLVEARRSDAESRKRRQRARKGGEKSTYIDRKERRRGTSPWKATKRKPRREASPETVAPRKRRRNSASTNPGVTLNLTESTRKKKATEAVRQKDTKKLNIVSSKRNRVLHSNAPGPSNKKEEETMKRGRRGQSKQRGDAMERKQKHRGRRTKTPPVNRDEKEKPRKNRRDSSDEDGDSTKSSENEVNQRTVTERRKSTPPREPFPQDANEHPGNPDEAVEEKLERPNSNEDDRTAIGNEA